MNENIKLVCVGEKVGKTAMLIVYVSEEHRYPHEYVPVNGKNIGIGIWDVQEAQMEYTELIGMNYTGAHVFLVCFSVVKPDGFSKVIDWKVELRNHAPPAAIILVGTQIDLRDDEETLEELRDSNKEPVTPEEGRSMAKKMKAACYCECSAITGVGVKEVFEEAIKAVMFPKKKSGLFGGIFGGKKGKQNKVTIVHRPNELEHPYEYEKSTTARPKSLEKLPPAPSDASSSVSSNGNTRIDNDNVVEICFPNNSKFFFKESTFSVVVVETYQRSMGDFEAQSIICREKDTSKDEKMMKSYEISLSSKSLKELRMKSGLKYQVEVRE